MKKKTFDAKKKDACFFIHTCKTPLVHIVGFKYDVRNTQGIKNRVVDFILHLIAET